MTQTQIPTVDKAVQTYSQDLAGQISKAINKLPETLNLSKDRYWMEMTAANGFNPDIEKLESVLRQVGRANGRLEKVRTLKSGWSEALKAAEAFVKAENAQGHKGQALFDLALRPSFVEIQDRINYFPTSREKIGDLEQDIADLKFQVDNFIYEGKFCRTCGEPMGDTSFAYCQKCHWAYVQAHPRTDSAVSAQPTKHKVKKPGSASRRSSNNSVKKVKFVVEKKAKK